MSGACVQRGGWASFGKRFRAASAVTAGADLVLELPYPYSGQSAETFADGAVRTLVRAGVDAISFGSESGDIAGSGACKLVGPAGEVELTEGVIAAKRHIHMTPADAEEYGVKDKDVVSVKVDTDGRSLIFGDVVVRVSDKYALAMHIDTDESNAAGCGRAQMGEIVK